MTKPENAKFAVGDKVKVVYVKRFTRPERGAFDGKTGVVTENEFSFIEVTLDEPVTYIPEHDPDARTEFRVLFMADEIEKV